MSDAATELWPLLRAEFQHLLNQALRRVTHCVNQLDNDQVWWRPTPENNSIGNLMLHQEGNLRQWGIAGLTGAATSRDRDAEFSADGGINADEMLARLAAVVDEVLEVLRTIDPSELSEHVTIQGFEVTRLGALMHTIPHFVGHTHQITQLTRQQLGDQYSMLWSPDDPRDEVPL